MAVFAYEALDTGTTARAGTITADTPALARHELRQRGLLITQLREVKTARGQRRLASRRQADRLSEIWRQLSMLLRTGIPLADSLAVLVHQHTGGMQTLLRQLHEAVRSGQSFAEALAQHPRWFDAVSLSIIRVGQASGALDQALNELADLHARRRAMHARLSTALIYPAILCIIGTGVVIFLTGYVVPQLLEVLTAAGRELPRPTRILKACSDALVGQGWIIAVAGLAGTMGFAAALRAPRFRRVVERVALRLPITGDMLRKAWISRVAMMLAILLRANVRFIDAVRTVRGGLKQQLLADEMDRLIRAIEAGSSIADPLRNSLVFPPLVVHMLGVGQNTGELPEILAQLRDGYDKEVQLALARFTAVLEPALIVVLSVIIGFVLFATLLPILETTRVVQ